MMDKGQNSRMAPRLCLTKGVNVGGHLLIGRQILGWQVKFHVGDVKSSVKERGQVRSWILSFRVQRRVLC